MEIRDLSTAGQKSAFVLHQRSKGHQQAVRELEQRGRDPSKSGAGADVGVVSGIGEDVPRLEKWIQALKILANKSSNRDFARDCDAASVGSQLPGSSSMDDSSKDAMGKLVYCMDEVLRRRMQESFKNCEKLSIALDERDQTLLVFIRCLEKKGELYETVLGIVRDYGTGHANCLQALDRVFDEACTVRNGRRNRTGDRQRGTDDRLDEDLKNKMRNSVRSAASDGGPAEAKALWEASPRAKAPVRQADVYFKNMMYIFRDAPHKYRSVQKAVWEQLDKPLREFLDALVTGDDSLLKLLENSRKFSLLFEQVQKGKPVEARVFLRIVRNFSYAAQRFNSMSEPVWKLFLLFPCVVDALVLLGDEWSKKLLLRFAGRKGYDLLVSAAMVADVMMLLQPCIRIEDQSDGDASLLASTVSKVRDDLHDLLVRGGIWLKEADGTCVHAALRAIQGRTFFFRDSKTGMKMCVAMGWPSPKDLNREGPIKKGEEIFCLFTAYLDANFPMIDIQNGFAAFDLESKFTMPERKTLLDSLAPPCTRRMLILEIRSVGHIRSVGQIRSVGNHTHKSQSHRQIMSVSYGSAQ